jgi:hypothetical protein
MNFSNFQQRIIPNSIEIIFEFIESHGFFVYNKKQTKTACRGN